MKKISSLFLILAGVGLAQSVGTEIGPDDNIACRYDGLNYAGMPVNPRIVIASNGRMIDPFPKIIFKERSDKPVCIGKDSAGTKYTANFDVAEFSTRAKREERAPF